MLVIAEATDVKRVRGKRRRQQSAVAFDGFSALDRMQDWFFEVSKRPRSSASDSLALEEAAKPSALRYQSDQRSSASDSLSLEEAAKPSVSLSKRRSAIA